MLQIDDTLISFDVLEQKFLCDLQSCKGICCIEGDAGAPLEPEEVKILEDLLPVVWDDLSEKSREIIKRQGVSYIDEDGEPVTSIVDGAECVFTCTDTDGICKCAIEKAYRAGKIDFYKPISCHLYPIRLKEYPDFSAVNYHRWKICKAGEVLGRHEQVRVYEFLKEPLIRRFGEEWYNELCEAAEAYLQEYGK